MTPDELQKLIKETWDLARLAQDAKEILTREEAAELVQLHPKVLVRYISEHGLPAHKIGSEYRFRRSELLQWINSQRIKVA
jgi:excisionase family DNA binding protein